MGRVVAGLLVASAFGCRYQSGMQSFDVHVAPQLTGAAAPSAPVEVDLVGVNDADYEKWSTYPLSKYWSPRDPLRTTSKVYVMSFSRQTQEPAMLRKDDPVWDAWKQQGATHLFVIAFLPAAKAQADADARRAELPLDRCLWKGTPQLEFE